MGSVSSGRGVSSNSEVVYTGTFAGVPSAVGRTGQLVQFTDMNNSFWYSDGTNYKPQNGECILQGCKYPAYVPQTGTVTAIGSVITITGGILAFTNGVWLYINATSGLTAGWYFAIMSSTTVGVLYGTAQTTINDSPSATPTTIPGDSAYTGEINEVTAYNWALPAGILGATGAVDADYRSARTTGGATATATNFKLGTTTFSTVNLTTTTLSARSMGGFKNLSAAQQIRTSVSVSGYAGGTAAAALMTENTANALNVVMTMQHPTTATDNIGILNSFIRIRV